MEARLLDEDDLALDELKSKMTERQKKDMADLLQKELRRRMLEKEKLNTVAGKLKTKSSVASSPLSSGLDRESLGEVYGALDGNLKSLRLQKLEAQLAEAKRQANRYRSKRSNGAGSVLKVLAEKLRGFRSSTGGVTTAVSARNYVLVGIIGVLALSKLLYSSGVIKSGVGQPSIAQIALQQDANGGENSKRLGGKEGVEKDKDPVVSARGQLKGPIDMQIASLSQAAQPEERGVIIALDARRVELEKRRELLDVRENEVQAQNQALTEKIAELRSLTERLSKIREEKDARYEARLEQLASVYGSMGPKEAAPLLAKLESDIALALLERMPGKKIGQVLSMMEPERAIDLTKRLSDRGKLQ